MSLVRAWLTLTSISFRRLLWSANTAMVLLPLGGCLLFILRRHHRHPEFTERGFRDFSEFMILVFASFVVPICAGVRHGQHRRRPRRSHARVSAGAAHPPALVLLAKFAATLPLVFGLVIGSYWLYCQLAGEVGQTAFPLYLPALVAMTAAYVCLFHLFAVAFRHSTIIALIYALFIELLLGNLPGIVKCVAVNYYGRSIMYDAGASEGLAGPTRAGSSPYRALAPPGPWPGSP